ncbi:Lrp/AsnC family transcriptional regulator [Sphingomonas nostoxanthinifaciens]|uniref:Lrp/AsnC family transcriptional regulator n=1 Tax=Sphingomonas nostoxanthinifaciens TaxID=2872652 RepID=UPI001CC21A3D|nr:Lrp/AsnC family transcriptional regulator [Sphingomonas nostoxanthinifaciens]
MDSLLQHLISEDIDRIDSRILRELSRDARVSDIALGERVHLSSTAVARRRKALEDRGFLQGYSADLDLTKLGFGTTVIVAIELSSQAERALNEFEEAVVQCPSMSFCSFVSGDTDFFMMIHVKSFEDYDRVYRRELSTLPHVAKIRSSFVMRKVLDRKLPTALLSLDD